jgi:hypothetical protein
VFKIKITHTPPIYAASTLEVHIHILSILDTTQNCSTPTLGVSIKNFPSSIASPFCYAIKLQVSFLLLPLSIYPKRGFGALKKRERKKEEKREEKEK